MKLRINHHPQGHASQSNQTKVISNPSDISSNPSKKPLPAIRPDLF